MDSYLNTTLRASESTMPEFHLLLDAARPLAAAWRIADQGVEIAGMADCDVTTSKFSTRMGPLSCSPPV